MANGLTVETRAAWAAHTSSSSVGTPASRATGKVDAEDLWERLREQACRALTSNPDVVFYVAFLASNRAYKAAAALSDQLDTLILAAEGATFPTVAVRVPAGSAPAGVPTSPESLQVTVGSLVQRATAAAPATKLGRRQALRGEEARATFLGAISPFLLEYEALLARIRTLAALASFSFTEYRKYALATPISRAEAALSTEYAAENASAFTTQNAAAAAALTAIGREPTLAYRVRYDQQFSPTEVALSVESTQVLFSKGSPSYAFIRVGDQLKSTNSVATVVAVTDTGLSLDVPVVLSGAYTIVPGPLSAFITLVEALDTFLQDAPAISVDLREQLTRIATASDANATIHQLARVQALVCGLSPTTEEVLQRRGLEIPSTSSSLQGTLLAYAPSLPKATRDSTLAIVDTLERNSFAYAASNVLSGNLSVLLGTLQGNAPGAYVGMQPGEIGDV